MTDELIKLTRVRDLYIIMNINNKTHNEVVPPVQDASPWPPPPLRLSKLMR